MKKLIMAVALFSTILLVSCGKKNNNQYATTPNDCYNQGMNPAYYQNNPWANNQWYNNQNQWGNPYTQNQWGQPYNQWGNQWNNGYAQNQWGNQYQNQWNPNNVGCVGYNGNQWNPTFHQGQPYYSIGGGCNLNTSAQTCPAGYVCQRSNGVQFQPPGYYSWQGSWSYGGQNPFQNGVCVRIQ